MQDNWRQWNLSPPSFTACFYTTDSHLKYAVPSAVSSLIFQSACPLVSPGFLSSPFPSPRSSHRLPTLHRSQAFTSFCLRIEGCSLPSGNFPLSSKSPPCSSASSPHAGLGLHGQGAGAAPSFAGPGVPAPSSPRARCRLGEHGRFRSRTRAGAGLTAAAAPCAPPSASLAGGRRGCSGLLFSRHGEELELRESRRAAPGGTAAQ